MSYKAKGKIIDIFQTEKRGENDFETRSFAIETREGNYIQEIGFQLTGNKTTIIDEYKVGDEVNIYFNLNGRKWNDKYITNLNAWRIEKKETEVSAPIAISETVTADAPDPSMPF